MSLRKIGGRFDQSESRAWRLMKRYGIPRRTLAEAGIEYPKASFSGNPNERAYLLGFRTGDLHVKQDGNQVRVETTTTHSAMWDLVASCFGAYGRVNRTPSKREDTFQWVVYGYLDKSFGFLLPKPARIPREIFLDQRLFLSFLSGYVDAEGNLRVFQNEDQAGVSFRINSEDEGILRDIRSGLRSMGYHVYFDLAREKGTVHGKTYRNHLWTIGMFRKQEVIDLVKRLTVRHREKTEWVRLILSAEEASWQSMKPLVEIHKLRISTETKEFIGEAERRYNDRRQTNRLG